MHNTSRREIRRGRRRRDNRRQLKITHTGRTPSRNRKLPEERSVSREPRAGSRVVEGLEKKRGGKKGRERAPTHVRKRDVGSSIKSRRSRRPRQRIRYKKKTDTKKGRPHKNQKAGKLVYREGENRRISSRGAARNCPAATDIRREQWGRRADASTDPERITGPPRGEPDKDWGNVRIREGFETLSWKTEEEGEERKDGEKRGMRRAKRAHIHVLIRAPAKEIVWSKKNATGGPIRGKRKLRQNQNFEKNPALAGESGTVAS